MNKFYNHALFTQHDRKVVFEKVLSRFKEPINFCIIGAERDNRLESICGDGWFSFYAGFYVEKNGGSLTIIDIDPKAIDVAKEMLSDFGDKVNFIVADGIQFLKDGQSGFNFFYLDMGNEQWQTYEAFKAIDLRRGPVLIDDFNPGGKADRVKICYPFYEILKANQIHELGFYKKMDNYGNNSFKIGKLELNYCRLWSPNRAGTNERAIEVALGQWFINLYNNDVKEVGAVMCYYGANNHEVFDPYDNHPRCKKSDVFDLDLTKSNCLSISTIEHILNDDGYSTQKDENASFKAVKKIVDESSNYLITFPIGAHLTLQNQLFKSNINYKLLRRENKRGLINNWFEVPNIEANMFEIYGHTEYFAGYYGNALCVCIVSNLNDIIN